MLGGMSITPGPSNSLSTRSTPRVPPELLAPAGDRLAAEAAVAAGADAVYFGLDTKTNFNARARAKNIPLDELGDLVAWLHRHGVKAYVTLNTLVFTGELAEAEQVLRHLAASGADAVLVQDLGVARLARAVCPTLPIHASTQMSLTSAEGIAAAESLGIERVILARELSIDAIGAIARQTTITLEVFVHGALCISYSGQCLASRTLGGRSANRGDCAQICRLPYRLACDDVSTESVPSYLLSPQDLAAFELVPELIQAGVGALKIEGRLKSADYVDAVVRHYRRAIDAAMAGASPQYAPEDVRRLEAVFSRGLSHGWLEGDRPKELVTGQGSAHRGSPLGKVTRVHRNRVEVELAMPVRRGDGVVFETDTPQENRQGGRIYGLYVGGRPATGAVDAGRVELTFARDAVALEEIRPGQSVRKTADAQIQQELQRPRRRSESIRRVALDLVVDAEVGRPLRIRGRAESGASCDVTSADLLKEAIKHPLDASVLREQLGRLGATPYVLRGLEARIEGRPLVPLSVLGTLRRGLVAQLDACAVARPREVSQEPQLEQLRSAVLHPMSHGGKTQPPVLHVLCRSPQQLAATLDAGVRNVIVEYRDIAAYAEAARTAHQRGAEIFLATPRIQKPGETWVFEAMARHEPDGVLARNLAALRFFAGFPRGDAAPEGRRLPVAADFSLNAANDLSVEWLLGQGAERVTPSLDLNRGQLMDLAARVPAERLEVVVDLQVPMFHSQHCLFCAHLSAGASRVDCGQPCRRHGVRLEDRKGQQHTVQCDALCRNTVFHAVPQSSAEIVPQLSAAGVRHYRIELLGDPPGRDVQWVLRVYGDLLSGRTSGRDAWNELRAIRGGRIARGTLR